MPLYFGMFVSVAAYLVGMALKKKLGWAILNPLLVAILLVMALLKATGISYGDYNQGASYISYFLTPATVCLAIPLYKQLELLKKNLAAVLCGITTGVAGSVLSIFAMSLVFRLEHVHYVSLLPKSITTAIGMGVAEEAGGIVTITIVSIIFTGILGNIVAEGWFKLVGIREPIAKGLALGTAAHAIGTSKALELGHRVIVVVNKIDRPDQRIHEVVDEVLELLMDLDATPEQLDSPMLFCSGRNGTASYSPDVPGTDLKPLFETILEYIPAPEADVDQPFQMLVSSIDYNDFVGRIAIGRIERGTLKQNQDIVVCNYHDPEAVLRKARATAIYEFEGLARNPVTESTAGNIIAMSGIPDITIGDTICVPDCVEALPFVKISAPTLEMTFSVNDSPFAGKEGKFVTSRQLRDRLYRETLKDVSLRVTDTDKETAFNVAGRGEMSLSILIETMRREGYEFQVSPARVLYQEIDGVKCEPIERLVVDVPGDCVGAVIEKLGARKADLVEMTPVGERMKIEFLIPARGLFGYRSDFLTDTKGEGIMASVFDSYAPYKGDISRRGTGSMISFETGESVTYGLFNAQERGTLFIGPGVPVYGGMVIGVSPRSEDITVNICKKKQLTNMRASGSDEALRLVPPKQMSLEQCLEFLADDELLEVTPKSLRMRKAILDHEKRMKALHGKK